MNNLETVKQLTAIYISYLATNASSDLLKPLCDVLALAQKTLTENEMLMYTNWHKTKWPDLYW